MEDRDLLRNYVKDADEASFRVLADKYTGLVFGCAFRRTGSRQIAEEATQNVFASLARKASGLRVERSLAAWLHRCAVLESSALLRAEGRHRRRVEALAEEMVAENDKLENSTMHCTTQSNLERNDLAAELDEALDHLSAADREIVLLRFFEEKSFAEIGEVVGRSDEACRKRVSRSLDKLVKLYQRRGLTVSAVAVGALLSAEMAKAAPTGLALASSNLAIASAAEVAPLAKALTVIQTMTYSKLGGIVAGGIAVCLLCGTGGYVAGKAEADKNADRLSFLERMPISVQPSVDGPEGAGVGASAGAIRQGATVAQILAAAAEQFRAGDGDRQAYQRGRATLAKIGGDGVPEALQFLEGVRDERLVWEPMLTGILTIWAERDPEAALDYATGVADGASPSTNAHLLGQLALAWARRDHEAAFEWFRINDVPVGVSHDEIRTSLYSGWAQTDAGAALQSIEKLPKEEAQRVMRAIAMLGEQREFRDRAIAAIAALTDTSLRDYGNAAVGKVWGEWEPENAANWFDTLSFESDEFRVEAATELADDWLENDTAAALDFLWPKALEGSEMREEMLEFLQDWKRRDAQAANPWLEKHKIVLEE